MKKYISSFTKSVVALAAVFGLAAGANAQILDVGVDAGINAGVGTGSESATTETGVQATTGVSATVDIEADPATTSEDEGDARVEVISVTRSDAEAMAGADMAAGEVSSEADLETFAAASINSDANLQGMEFSDEEIAVSYKQPGKILGFIPVLVTVEASLDAEGNIDLDYPWYQFIVVTDRAELESELQSEVGARAAGADLAAQSKAEIASRLHSALRENLAASAEVSADAEGTVEIAE